MSSSVRGPTPNSSLHRPTGSFDISVRPSVAPIVNNVTQPRVSMPNVSNLVIQGAAATAGTFHTMSNSGTLSIPETDEIRALRAQLDAEDQVIAQQHQQELLNLQQQAQTSGFSRAWRPSRSAGRRSTALGEFPQIRLLGCSTPSLCVPRNPPRGVP